MEEIESPDLVLSEEEKDKINYGIWTGLITLVNLPLTLYKSYCNYFKGAISKGFGLSGYDLYLNQLEKNVYLFSGAKTFNYVYSAKVLIKDKKIKDFDTFKKEMNKVYNEYNDNWLKTEYQTALYQADSAKNWLVMKKQHVKKVRYVAVIDSKTAEICRRKNGIVKEMSDPFWKTQAPISHYNCRCKLVPEYDLAVTPTPSDIINPTMPFRNNVGESMYVFTKDHAYFNVPNKYKKLRENNFGLPVNIN